MPSRRTKRGALRGELTRDWDVLICGASFGGLAVARELAGAVRSDGSAARILMLDRYEIGERPTSACCAPTAWLEVLGLMGSHRQTFRELVFTTAHGSCRWQLPWSLSTFDYAGLCELLDAQNDCEFETATVHGRTGGTVHTDRGDVTAPLIVDALGWRRVLAGENGGYQPPDAPLSRALEVHLSADSGDLAVWIDRDIVPAGGAWSFPADGEVRIGVGSFDPRFHVRDSTVELAEGLGPESLPSLQPQQPDGSAPDAPGRHLFQGNWIPHRLRSAVAEGVCFVGDSAGHCIPLTAEGIRTAFYFGIACGRELREALAGTRTSEHALRRYAAFSDSHGRKYRAMLRAQQAVPRMWPRALHAVVRAVEHPRLAKWAFDRYLMIAPPAGWRPSTGDEPASSARTVYP